MLEGKQILAVVPARSGSKGIPNKNMQLLKGISLIGRAGLTLSRLPFIDAKVISTDSEQYADEGRRYGLAVPCLRPERLSTDAAGAVETMQHMLVAAERHYATSYDIVLIVEPTSPMRTSEDIAQTTRRLIETGADSVVTVSRLASKGHPLKLLQVEDDRLRFFQSEGRHIQSRQALTGDFFWRNGVCYALTRACLMEKGMIFTDYTVAEIISHPVVNIDDALDLAWAEFLFDRQAEIGGMEQ